MSIDLVLKLSDMQEVINDYKKNLISIKDAIAEIKRIGKEAELIEHGQKVIQLDREA